MLEENKQTPKVSVTVVTYNHGQWLAECLESIVTQETNFPFEVIVGDDASTDGITQDILRDYADRFPHLIVPVFRDKNINGTQNFLDVLRRTQGEYIAHIDGDDLMQPGKLQKQADYLDSKLECVMVTHLMRWINSTGSMLKDESPLPEQFDVNHLVESCNCVSSSARMFRRTAVLTWNAAPNERVMDFRQNLEIASSGVIGCINEYLGVYRYGVGITGQSIESGFLPDLVAQAFLKAKCFGVKIESILIGYYRYKTEILMWCMRNGVNPPQNIVDISLPIYFRKENLVFFFYFYMAKILGHKAAFQLLKNTRKFIKALKSSLLISLPSINAITYKSKS